MANDKYQKSLLAQGIITKDVTNLTNVKDIPIRKIKINPNQPRKSFDPDKLQELTESIKSAGVIGPLVVRPSGEFFEIVAGERRYRAAKSAGIDKVPCIIRELSDTEAYELSLVENIQRDDLDPIEEAMAYKHLMDIYGYTFREFKQAIGKSQGYINERIQLLNLPAAIKDKAFALRTRTRHARHILKIKGNEELQEKVFNKVINENLTHEETSELVELLVDDSLPDTVKTFVLKSKELKPAQAKTIIASALPEKSMVKVMKSVAKKTAAVNAEIDLKAIEKLITYERDKTQTPETPQGISSEQEVARELRGLIQSLLAKLKDNAAMQSTHISNKTFTSKKSVLLKELEEFLPMLSVG